MAWASHLHRPVDGSASSVGRSLAVLERTLSSIASQTAVAAESLRGDGVGPARTADREVASWWLDRLVRSALATRDTCRAARAALADDGSSHIDDGCCAPPWAASADATSHAFADARGRAGRWIVVGYDGSAAAERALLRAADEAGERDVVVIVTTTRQPDSVGPAEEPLREPTTDASDLLAAGKATVSARCSVADVVGVAREGDPAAELLEVARAANADLVIVGRRGEDVAARTLPGSVAARVVEYAHCDVLVVA